MYAVKFIVFISVSLVGFCFLFNYSIIHVNLKDVIYAIDKN